MPDIGLGEIVVLVALAVILFGPEKLPELVRRLARVVNGLRELADSARTQLTDELGPEFDDLKKLDVRDLNPRRFVQRNVMDAITGSGSSAYRPEPEPEPEPAPAPAPIATPVAPPVPTGVTLDRWDDEAT